jgi:hypothetical protein
VQAAASRARHNLGNSLRTLPTPEPIKDWSLTSLKEKLIKIGAKVVSHGRYVVFQMAEVLPTTTVPGDSAAHCRTTAAATTSVTRSIVMHSRATERGLRPNARKNDQIRPSNTASAAWKAGCRPFFESGLPATSE